ncbi:unnamed protein product [Effrenium voratum]|nr:unnamed protein product [Effrenium voratum]
MVPKLRAVLGLQFAGALQSAYRNLSEDLAQCNTSGGLACDLGCVEHEKVLEESFEPWWDHQMPWRTLLHICELQRQRGSAQAFLGAIHEKRVFFTCCSQSSDQCEASALLQGLTDVEVLLGLVAELAQVVLQDTVFLFNTGDQPLTDRAYWSPVPQFHWVRSGGHWTVPLPNPFQLKAHAKNLLGDSEGNQGNLVPWGEKIPKLFWRGALSAPDLFALEDIGTLPRVRLMKLAKENQDLFDVGITNVDREMYRIAGRSRVQALVQQLGGTVKHEKSQQQMPRYRYLINVAAVLSSWRLVEMLATGSLLLLQEGADHELILEWLTPWEHFVPVSQGLSDLVPTLRWLEAHPDLAERIAAQGFRRFKERVRRQDTWCYLWQAFRAMADSHTPPEPAALAALTAEPGWREVPAEKLRKLKRHRSLQEFTGKSSSEL